MAVDALLSRESVDRLAGLLLQAPHGSLRSRYDAETDVLYVNFDEPASATDSELTEDDIIVRYRDGEVIGFTVLHASRRVPNHAEGI